MTETKIIREVERAHSNSKWTPQHRVQEHRRNKYANRDKGRHRPFSANRRFVTENREWHVYRKNDKRDYEVDPQCEVFDGFWNVPFKPEPDERLVELVKCEDERQGCDGEVTRSPLDVSQGVDADRANDGTADKICLRREAHICTVSEAFAEDRAATKQGPTSFPAISHESQMPGMRSVIGPMAGRGPE